MRISDWSSDVCSSDLYYRTSSATNVGADKDSLTRQQQAVRAYAAASRVTIEAEFYDAAVSGADRIDAREGFADLLGQIDKAGIEMTEDVRVGKERVSTV